MTRKSSKIKVTKVITTVYKQAHTQDNTFTNLQDDKQTRTMIQSIEEKVVSYTCVTAVYKQAHTHTHTHTNNTHKTHDTHLRASYNNSRSRKSSKRSKEKR